MRWRRFPVRAAGVFACASVAAVLACEDPTEVTLVLTTDVPCSMLEGTTITVGTADALEDKDLVADTSACDPDASGLSSIGTFVVVPSHGRSDAFAVRVVSGVGRQAHDCAPGGQTPDYTNCIVARRELTFVPHTPLTLPIVMRKDCENRACGAQQTCVDGECVSDMILTPNRCTGGGACSESVLLDGGAVAGSEASTPLADATTDAPIEDGLGVDVSAADVSIVDAPPLDGRAVDGPTSDGSPGDAARTDSGVTDATMTDAAVADAALADVVTTDAGGADAPPQEAGNFTDAGVLGPCVAVGTSSGVACGGSTCPSGDVCCVTQPSAGSPTFACSAAASCNTSATGPTTYSALACRNVGDCTAGNVCCLVPSQTVGTSYTTVCRSSCQSFVQVQACQNSCECPMPTTCDVATSPCNALSLGTCGGTCI
jgi:hypothetical protein